jgi:hypothetical protein
MFSRDFSVKQGTACGTLLSILPNLRSEDVLKTVVLAAVGAIASFLVTLMLKKLTRRKS